MTGIAAIFTRAEDSRETWRSAISSILRHLAHRGSQEEVLVGTCGALGRRAHAHNQTTTAFAENGLLLVADVRLDNRESLDRELALPPDWSDAQVLLAAYKTWGTGCVQHLLGDFVFVVLDTERREICCARDAFGTRPLYFHHAAGVLRCASDPAALLAQPEIGRRANLDQVANLIAGAYTETDATLFEGIRSVPAGHFLIASSEALTLHRHWWPERDRALDVDDETAAELVRQAVIRSVGRRVRSRQRLAIYLSGGLDSAVVASQVERLRRDGAGPGAKPLIVHASFPGSAEDETPFSDAVADMWGLPRVNARPLDDPNLLRPSIDVPVDIPWDPRLGMWDQLHAEASRGGAAVGLTGDGVDECLRATGFEWADALRAGRLDLVAKESGLMRRPWSRSSWRRLLVEGLQPLLPLRLQRGMVRRQPILGPDHSVRIRELCRARFARRPRSSSSSLVQDELCRLFEDGDLNLVMTVNERIAARSGMELRFGLLDRELVELFLALPHHHRHTVGLDKPKPVFRRAMQDLLPPIVLARHRSGSYGAFLSEVIFVQHRDAVRALFSRSRLGEASIVDQRVLHRLAQGDLRPHPAFSATSWTLQLSRMVAMEILLRQL